MTKKLKLHELLLIVGFKNLQRIIQKLADQAKEEDSYKRMLELKRGFVISFQQMRCSCQCENKCPEVTVAIELHFIWNDNNPTEEGILLDIQDIYYTNEKDYSMIEAHIRDYEARKAARNAKLHDNPVNTKGIEEDENLDLYSLIDRFEQLTNSVQDPRMN